eukprot:scaffold1106_cov126-Cylindrotheca_fusiformis.AAC.3
MSPSFGMLVTSSSNRRRGNGGTRGGRESRNNSSDNTSSPGQERRDMPTSTTTSQPTPKKSLCVASIFKCEKGEKLGLNLKFSNTMGRIYVSDIKRTSKFADTPLQTGMVLLTVNGQPCPRSVKETATLIKSIEGDLTFVACSLKSSNGSSPMRESHASSSSPPRSITNAAASAANCATTPTNTKKKKQQKESTSSNKHKKKQSSRRISELAGPAEFVSTNSFSDLSAALLQHDDECVETTLIDNIPTHIGSLLDADDEEVDADSNPFSDLDDLSMEDDILVQQQQKPKATSTPSSSNRHRHSCPPSSKSKRSNSDSGSPSVEMAAAAAATLKPKRAVSDTYSPSAFASSSAAASARASSKNSNNKRRDSSFLPNFDTSYGQEQMKSFTAAATSWLLGEDQNPNEDKKPSATATSKKQQHGNGDENDEQFHQYPPPPPNSSYSMGGGGGANGTPPPPALERNRQLPNFFMTPGAYSIPGPSSISRASSTSTRGASSINSSKAASSAQGSDDSSFLRSFYESGDFSDFDDDSDLEFETGGNPNANDENNETYIDGILDTILKDEDEENAGNSASLHPTTSYEEDSNNLVVAAELTQDAEAQIEDRVRRSIMQDTAVASVVMVEHGGKTKSSPSSAAYNHKDRRMHRNVKEKLFGDGKKNSMEVILAGLEASPDDYIRKRDLLPWTVKRNATTNLWVASVQTNQKAWEQAPSSHELSLEQMRSCHTFSGATEEEAYEAGLAMAPPVMLPFSEHPFCFLCKSKFAVFQRPKHCKNCGVVICSTCCCSWSSKRLPDTYRKKNTSGTVLVCLGCDWVATNFQQALLRGNMSKAITMFRTGNVNLRTPYGPYSVGSSNKKRRDEVMYPIHMAVMGGNVALVQWLISDRFVPTKRTTPAATSNSKRFSDNLVLRTSKGRSLLRLALGLEHSDILKFLVSNQKLDLLEEDLRMDYRKVLRHLTVLLETVPAAMLAQRNHLPASFEVIHSSSAEFQSPTEEGDVAAGARKRPSDENTDTIVPSS